MKCKACDYPLWNMASRVCPECGRAFSPVEYQFASNSVRFCCPKCDHPYLGTDEHGLPTPREFACLECGEAICLDDMVVRPGLGVEENRTKFLRMPWLEREQRGPVRAWFSTSGMAIGQPTTLMRATPAESSVGAAAKYAGVSIGVIGIAGGLVGSFCGGGNMIFASFAGGGPGSMTPMLLAFVLGPMASGLVLLAVLVLMMIVVGHGILCITGKHRGPISRTAQAVCYSTGALLFMLIPCVGTYIGWLPWVIAATIMVTEAHRVHPVRSILAVAVPAVGGAVLMAAAIFFSMMWAMGTFARGGFPGGPGGMTGTKQTASYVWAIQSYATLNNGSGPTHASEILLDDTGIYWTMEPFVAPGGVSRAVSIGATTADQLDSLPKLQQFKEVAAEVDTMPANTVAHRMGDYVFTYHGIDLNSLNTPGGALWLVVCLEEGAIKGIPSDASVMVEVGLSDSTTTSFPYSQMPAMLAAQNAVRRAAGLPALPDPATVLTGSPATSNGFSPELEQVPSNNDESDDGE